MKINNLDVPQRLKSPLLLHQVVLLVVPRWSEVQPFGVGDEDTDQERVFDFLECNPFGFTSWVAVLLYCATFGSDSESHVSSNVLGPFFLSQPRLRAP